MPSGEAYERQLRWRLKQTELGKSSQSYRCYSQTVPKNQRSREHPSTPDPYDARMSKRQFEGRIKAWRSSLRAFTESRCTERAGLDSSETEAALFLSGSEVRKLGLFNVRIIIESDFPMKNEV